MQNTTLLRYEEKHFSSYWHFLLTTELKKDPRQKRHEKGRGKGKGKGKGKGQKQREREREREREKNRERERVREKYTPPFWRTIIGHKRAFA